MSICWRGSGGSISFSSLSVGNCRKPGVDSSILSLGTSITPWDRSPSLRTTTTEPPCPAGAGRLRLTWSRRPPGASAFSYPLIFLPFISSAFVPTNTMPGPVRVFAEHQPVTSIVNAIRDLFTQHPVGTDIWIALAWCVGILIVAYIFAMVIYRRRIS
jgi:hypothetical protein